MTLFKKLQTLLWDFNLFFDEERNQCQREMLFSLALSVVGQDREERGDLHGAYKCYRRRIYLCPGQHSFRRDMLLAWEQVNGMHEKDRLLVDRARNFELHKK